MDRTRSPVAQVGSSADEDHGSHGRESEQGEGVVGDFQESVADVAHEHARGRCTDGGREAYRRQELA